MDAEKSAKKAEAAEAPVKGKGGKKPVRKETTPKVKASKETKSKRENIPVKDVCVFAFRLSTQERTRIHDAAGSAKASRFVLAAALAASDGDVEAFKQVVASRATE